VWINKLGVCTESDVLAVMLNVVDLMLSSHDPIVETFVSAIISKRFTSYRHSVFEVWH
jgi:hypothetical protein